MRNYHKMVEEALVALKGKDEGHVHAHGLGAIKHAIEANHHDLPSHWEKHMSAAVKMMVDKHELVHVPNHPEMYKMSKALEEKQARKRGPRKPKVEMKQAAPKTKGPAKREKAPAKAKHPAKRAKKASAKVKA